MLHLVMGGWSLCNAFGITTTIATSAFAQIRRETTRPNLTHRARQPVLGTESHPHVFISRSSRLQVCSVLFRFGNHRCDWCFDTGTRWLGALDGSRLCARLGTADSWFFDVCVCERRDDIIWWWSYSVFELA